MFWLVTTSLFKWSKRNHYSQVVYRSKKKNLNLDQQILSINLYDWHFEQIFNSLVGSNAELESKGFGFESWRRQRFFSIGIWHFLVVGGKYCLPLWIYSWILQVLRILQLKGIHIWWLEYWREAHEKYIRPTWNPSGRVIHPSDCTVLWQSGSRCSFTLTTIP
jgi:hypothetical protein